MAKAVTSPAKGSRDFLPRDVRRRMYVTGVIREVFQSHGFAPLETPAMERLDTLMGKYGEEGDQLLFKILMRGEPLVGAIRNAHTFLAEPGALVRGRSGETAPRAEPLLADLGLRYDLTVPLARVVAEYQGKLPPVFKRYQIQPVWRADTPGKARFREFYQCDVDVVGSTSKVVEAEVLGAAAECLTRLGFRDFKLRINHRGLLRAIVEHAGIDAALETEAIVAIDKLDKIGVEGVERELAGRGVAAESAKQLLTIIAEAGELASLRKVLAGSARGQGAIDEIETVFDFASVTAARPHLTFDVALARGLGYYTGCIFEIAVAGVPGSLGGGGRYDGLIGMFLNKEVPACGLSLGLERILVL
ncbi:MAG TPA: ATP phosphoribosyltransferase regulatory subunit, partial [Polyangiales bacterium]|nr:ATP phosphoribosyltransferase regulatory subunit [Polyangiales bacterium]